MANITNNDLWCNHGYGLEDWINDGCLISSSSRTANKVLWSFVVFAASTFWLYIVYRLIHIARVIYTINNNNRAARIFMVRAAVIKPSPAPNATAVNGAGVAPTPATAKGGANGTANLAANNAAVLAAANASSESSTNLRHLRFPLVMSLTLFVAASSGIAFGILHLQGQVIGVDVAVSVLNALTWAMAWLAGHAFTHFWVRLGYTWARSFMTVPPWAELMMSRGVKLQIVSAMISVSMSVIMLTMIGASPSYQRSAVRVLMVILAFQTALFAIVMIALGRTLRNFLQQTLDEQNGNAVISLRAATPATSAPVGDNNSSATPKHGLPERVSSDATSGGAVLITVGGTGNGNGGPGGGAATTRLPPSIPSSSVSPIAVALHRVNTFMKMVMLVPSLPIPAILLIIWPHYLTFYWPIQLGFAAGANFVQLYTMKTISLPSNLPSRASRENKNNTNGISRGSRGGNPSNNNNNMPPLTDLRTAGAIGGAAAAGTGNHNAYGTNDSFADDDAMMMASSIPLTTVAAAASAALTVPPSRVARQLSI